MGKPAFYGVAEHRHKLPGLAIFLEGAVAEVEMADDTLNIRQRKCVVQQVASHIVTDTHRVVIREPRRGFVEPEHRIRPTRSPWFIGRLDRLGDRRAPTLGNMKKEDPMPSYGWVNNVFDAIEHDRFRLAALG